MKSPLQLYSILIGASCILAAAQAYTYSGSRLDEICGVQNGRKLYLELGEKGALRAGYVPEAPPPEVGATRPSHWQCSLEVVTCPSCVVTVTFKSLNLTSCSSDSTCRCDYVWITEPPYENSGTPFCGSIPGGSSTIAYRSLTRIVNIGYFYSTARKDVFEIEYRSERNKQVLGLMPPPPYMKPLLNLNMSRGGILTTPFFPANYPRDLGIEYFITSMDQRSVQVTFSDFQVSPSSIMEFYDWNGQRLDVTSGAVFRPQVVISTGPSMLIRFYANGGTGLGFKGTYSFLPSDAFKNPVARPNTNCGGFVENLGGAITMMDMAPEGEVKYFDCIWIIKPPRNYFHLKTHLYLKIAQFSEFGGNTELVVRQGVTSEGVPMENLRSPVSELMLSSRTQREIVIPLEVGFYVALRGAFTSRSKLTIVYSSFSFSLSDCFAGVDFMCKNLRCISARLTCDGFDHCGDNSDEPITNCNQDWEEEGQMDRRRNSNVPNYFFPKMDRYPDLKTAALIFLVSCLGLVLLISTLLVLLYRMGSRARQQRELQNRLRTISELLAADNARVEELQVDEPPTYEAPPTYDQIVKVASGENLSIAGSSNRVEQPRRASRSRSRSKNGKNRRRAKSTPGFTTAGMENVGLRVALPRSPSTRRSSVWSADDQGGSAPFLMLAARNSGTTPIPDSPPPPYMAQPSMAGNFSQESLLARALQQTALIGGASSVPTMGTTVQQTSVSQELLGAEPVLSEVISPCSTMNSIADEAPVASTSGAVCKLASMERFDELEASQENFANFERVEVYPACGSMTPGSQGGMSRATMDEIISGAPTTVPSRHSSQELLDQPAHYSQEVEAWAREAATRLMNYQVEALRTQIAAQNSTLAEAVRREVGRRPSDEALLAQFIEVLQRRESSCSSASDDSQTKQFF